MAKAKSRGDYWYRDGSGSIKEEIHPGIDKKTGNPRPPSVKDHACWADKNFPDVWFYPGGVVKVSGKCGKNDPIIPFVEDPQPYLNSPYESRLETPLDWRHKRYPFWRFVIDQWNIQSWKDEWAFRSNENQAPFSLGGHGVAEWWRAEIKAFLSIIKELTEKGVYLDELTVACVAEIKTTFGKKKEATVA